MSRTPIHPGEILRDELEAMDNLSAAAVARVLKVPTNRLTQLMAGKRNMTPDTALRLGKWLGTTPEFWMNLQRNYDLRLAKQKISAELAKIPSRSDDAA